jgi:hypothetical protein
MQRPVPWLNYVYTQSLDARQFYHYTLKQDANGIERLWHFWVRKSAAMLFLSVMAGGACMIPTALVLMWVPGHFGSFDWDLYLTPRAVFGAYSIGFFIWMIRSPPNRPS